MKLWFKNGSCDNLGGIRGGFLKITDKLLATLISSLKLKEV